MINVRQYLRENSKTSDINMAPLIDMVFLLLIFFYGYYQLCKRDGN